jgi:hypothetical protein
VLKQNILVVLAEHLFNILRVVQEHAAHDRRPSPLKAIAIGGFVSWIATRDRVLGAMDWKIRHQ